MKRSAAEPVVLFVDPGFAFRRRVRRRSRRLPVVALLAPALLFLAAFTYWPLLRVFADSMMVGRFTDQHALGLDNYRRLFTDAHFARAAWNNAVYAAGTIVPSLMLALLFALALRDTTRLTTVLRTLVAMPLMIPLVAAAALFSFILLPGEGLLDFYLAKLGVPMINWLGDSDLALGSVVWLTSPEIAGEWSRFTGYFAPRKAAYDLPEMKEYIQQHPDAKVALDQLEYAVPWFDTYNTVAVRKAIEDQVQAILSAKTTPADAVQAAQKSAEELLRPYVDETALKRLA